MHGGALGDGDESVGAAVESVGGTRPPRSPVVAGARAGVLQQRVDQRVSAVTADGVDVHPRRLVAHDEVAVFVRDGDRAVERQQRVNNGADQLEDITGDHTVVHTAAVTVDGDALFRDERPNLTDRHGNQMGFDDVDQPHRWVGIVQHETVDDWAPFLSGRTVEILDERGDATWVLNAIGRAPA